MQSTLQNSPFAGLLGQQRAKSLLERSLGSGRIAHAYLFRGPEGVGKKLFAAAMAKALNCRTSGPASACDWCVSCKKYLSGNHPDYLVESPEKEAIKIERIRELTKTLSYPPYESERRVIVLENVHTMRAEAANSLLKTLEEPPAGNVLILTAETSKNVLPTIRSRCQVIPFFPLNVTETSQILEDVHGIAKEKARLLARLSEGSPGKALLFDKTDMITTWKGVVSVLSDPRYLDDRHSPTILKWAQQMADLKENLPPLLGLLRIWLRDMLGDTGAAGASGSDLQDRSRSRVFEGLAAVDRAEQELSRNCNRALVCEILLFRLQ
jgi:DNA polymerase III subunit delta'